MVLADRQGRAPDPFSHELAGRHHHRRSLHALCREYLRSSSGCARFVRRHPDCPLARKRLRQAIFLPAAALAVPAAVAALALLTHQATPLLAVGVASVAAAVGSMRTRAPPRRCCTRC